MKNVIIIAISAIIFVSCNNADNKSAENKSPQPISGEIDKKTTEVTSKSKDTTTSAVSITEILSRYLKMKNAFANDNDKDAASAGNEMVKDFAGFNKAGLSPNQAKIFSDIADDAKEHAEHIGSNGGNIKHQREHFDMLSKDIYQLVKAFGGRQKLYYDHCPMYNDGKGANWISETKEIANPYLGKSMPTCGTVKEELK